jgi:hypothetical protein
MADCAWIAGMYLLGSDGRRRSLSKTTAFSQLGTCSSHPPAPSITITPNHEQQPSRHCATFDELTYSTRLGTGIVQSFRVRDLADRSGSGCVSLEPSEHRHACRRKPSSTGSIVGQPWIDNEGQVPYIWRQVQYESHRTPNRSYLTHWKSV